MELTQDIISSLGTQCRKDRKLAVQIAKELIAQAEPLQVARLVLDAKTASELLIQHVQSDLAHTVAVLNGADSKPKKRGRPAARVAAKKGPASAKKETTGSRHRMSDKEVVALKKAVCSFIKKKPGSSRAAVQAAVTFPSLGAYNRIMKELVQEKAIKQKGERRMAVYQ